MNDRPTPETDALDCELHNPRVLQDRYSEMMEHARKLERERDEAREQANVMHEQWLSKGRCCENLAEELHEVKQQRDDYKWQLHIAKGEIAEARKMERAWKKEAVK